MNGEIIFFENQDIRLEVNLKDETVWLNAKQIAKLFGRDIKTIRKHINNAINEELDNSVVANFATTNKHGSSNKTQTNATNFYNLDVIISVGYRVKSKNGIIFRRWATNTLKDYLIRGYAVNKKRLEYLEKSIKLIDIASRIDDEISGYEAKEVISVINSYSKAFKLLDDYDHHKIIKPIGNSNKNKIAYDDCKNIIQNMEFNNKSYIFGLEKDKGLESIINNVYQSYNGKELYNSVEEKAANLLYLIIKNHPFIDGNKRIAATLFIYFLNFYKILYNNDKININNKTLVALTLLIAESNPKEKKIMVDLVMNLLINN